MKKWNGISLTGLTSAHVCTCPNLRPSYPFDVCKWAIGKEYCLDKTLAFINAKE